MLRGELLRCSRAGNRAEACTRESLWIVLLDERDHAFADDAAQIELVAGNFLASKESSGLSASKREMLERVVRGGNWGDTAQNVKSALDAQGLFVFRNDARQWLDRLSAKAK